MISNKCEYTAQNRMQACKDPVWVNFLFILVINICADEYQNLQDVSKVHILPQKKKINKIKNISLTLLNISRFNYVNNI